MYCHSTMSVTALILALWLSSNWGSTYARNINSAGLHISPHTLAFMHVAPPIAIVTSSSCTYSIKSFMNGHSVQLPL